MRLNELSKILSGEKSSLLTEKVLETLLNLNLWMQEII